MQKTVVSPDAIPEASCRKGRQWKSEQFGVQGGFGLSEPKILPRFAGKQLDGKPLIWLVDSSRRFCASS